MSTDAPDDAALIAALKREMSNGPDDAFAERVKARLGQSLVLGAAWSAASTVAKPASAAVAKSAAALPAGAAAPLTAASGAGAAVVSEVDG